MGALHEALCKAIADCGEGLEKGRQAKDYKFRGIDQALNFLNPIMARHQLALVPHNVLDEVVVERQSKAGNALYFARAKIEFRLYHASGESLPVMAWAEAMDSQDKALNKVMSICWKYAAIQTFCIPVEDVADENPGREDMEPTRRPVRSEAPETSAFETTAYEPRYGSRPPAAPLEFMLGELQGTLVSEAAPGTIERYMVAVEHHAKTHPELPKAELARWRAHFAACKAQLAIAKEREQKKTETDDIPY